MQWNLKAAEIITRVRQERPLVHHITNLVVTNISANATLAVGASPVMAHALEEVREMARLAGAVVLNIGTLTHDLVRAMIAAGEEANQAGVPVILDPVGVGATGFRTRSVAGILNKVKVDILRGNAAEITVLSGRRAVVKGVDAGEEPENTREAVREVSLRFGAVVAATGAVDYVSDGTRLLEVHNGHHLLTTITGSGCMLTSVIGAFRAVEPDGLLAATAALACYGYAGELAAARSNGPGSFQVQLFDTLFNLQPQAVAAEARIVEECSPSGCFGRG